MYMTYGSDAVLWPWMNIITSSLDGMMVCVYNESGFIHMNVKQEQEKMRVFISIRSFYSSGVRNKHKVFILSGENENTVHV